MVADVKMLPQQSGGNGLSEYLRRTWARVDLDAIRENFYAASGCVRPQCRIMAVVKADGYGHGAVPVARVLLDAGASWLGVSNLDEALQLREAEIDAPILVLGYTPPEEASVLARYNITQTVLAAEYGRRLNERAEECGVRIRVHIKLDTGMGRIGIPCLSQDSVQRSADEIQGICALSALDCEGIYTHFATADERDDGGFTRRQFELFNAVLYELSSRGVEFEIRHCCNSAAMLHYPDMQMDVVRLGLILYGLYPDGWLKELIDVRPAMELKTVISEVKDVGGDVGVSYGRTFITGGDTKLATVPLGYADGYSRKLSGQADMLVNGRRARVAGRVCMDQCVIDVSNAPDVSEGQTVTLFGADGKDEIQVEELTDMLGTINYEFVCIIGKRVPRIYYSGGLEVDYLNYIL